MANWHTVTPQLGLQPIESKDTVQNHPLGTIVRARHLTYGEGEFVYLKGVASAVAGSLVFYDKNHTAVLCTSAVQDPAPIGAMVTSTTASYYGWAQISGVAYVAKSSSLCLLQGANIGATGGAAVAVSTGNIILGAAVALHASVVSPAEAYVYVTLTRPHGASDVS